MAVASQDSYKMGGCPVVISSQRGAVIVLIVNMVHQIRIIFVLIIHKDSNKYTLVGKKKRSLIDDLKVPELLSKEGAVNLNIGNPGTVHCQNVGAVVSQMVPTPK